MPPEPPLIALVRRNLAAFERRAEERPSMRRAAVAATLVMEGGEPCFLLTRRAAHLKRHANQWSLPGGRLDPGEGAREAALRELAEEVGLVRGPEHILGLLDDYVTRSGYVMTPVVVWGGEAPELRPDPAEVAWVHRVPLGELAAEGVPQLHAIPESERPVLSIPMPSIGTLVFTPTAAILYQLHEVAVRGREVRIDGYEAPLFAWR